MKLSVKRQSHKMAGQPERGQHELEELRYAFVLDMFN